jgi:hypothetical protein
MHKAKHLQFKIDQLRQDKIIFAVESISVFIFCLFISIFLPNLLIRYVYTDPNMVEAPKIFDYIPVFSFGLGTLYFIYMIVSNISRFMQVKKLEQELEVVVANHEDTCDCGHDHSHHGSSSKSESVGLLAEKLKSAKTKRSK